jgi:8-oxo-dGTP diphosphatase
MSYTYDYPRPALTSDCVVFGVDQEELQVLLIQRDRDPFAGKWALPGGFVEIDEAPEKAAHRELQEETGLTGVDLEQFHTFGEPKRDPRGRTVSVAYFGLVNIADHAAQAADDARSLAWLPVRKPPALAFDHDRILAMACARLNEKLRCQPIGFELLPRKFPLSQLQHLYETILGTPLDRRRFRRRLLGSGLLEETPETRKAARLYRFNKEKYRQLAEQGFYL